MTHSLFQEQTGHGSNPGGDRSSEISRRNPAPVSGSVEGIRSRDLRRASLHRSATDIEVSLIDGCGSSSGGSTSD